MGSANILQLGIKELRTLRRDPIMIILIIYAFSGSIYAAAKVLPETLHKAPIAIIDEDHSELSERIDDAFYPPYFMVPSLITWEEEDARLDAGLDTFIIDIPPNFQKDFLAGRKPIIQVNIDATRMSQAFTGHLYVQNIITEEILAFSQRYRSNPTLPVDVALRVLYNPNLIQSWFGAVMELINSITMLSVILTGAAFIREREHGTVEHLLVMPVTPVEIMVSKIWAMALVVLVATACSMALVIQGLLAIPIQGSIPLFLTGALLQLFATTSMGIFLGTMARSMPQFGLLAILVLLPLEILSGGITPRESMPEFIQNMMLAAPNTYFVMLAQAILFRGAGFLTVWPQFLALILLGTILFVISLARFRKTLELMQV
ncbi:ABC transporter permease [Candidatus Protochlamydia phocaeensis]|uniref:ABC transporter permease n=1 Tax=Candidatus Protochlamydia phocaeensis TaxID=1414722 RepID=UPI00083888DD